MAGTKRNSTTLVKGQKIAEKWTEETVLPILEAMWETISKAKLKRNAGNPVRANAIKTLGEICLIHDVTYDQWEYWKEKFKESDAISRIFKKIEWIIENRMVNSGTFMDIFVLKNKYGYHDGVQKVAQTDSKGNDMPPPDLTKFSASEIKKMISAGIIKD